MSRLPFEAFLALRYLRPRRTFVSVITIISVLGVLLGVAVLIIVISVMSGFDREWRARILGFNAHMKVIQTEPISRRDVLMEDFWSVMKVVETQPGVKGVSPYIRDQVLLQTQPEEEADQRGLAPVMLGVDPETLPSVSVLPTNMIAGQFELDYEGLLVGREFADALGLDVGDRVAVYSARTLREMQKARGTQEETAVLPNELTVRGIFDVGYAEYNAMFVVVSIETAQELSGLPEDSAQGLQVMLDDPFLAEQVRKELVPKLGRHYTVVTWPEENPHIFNALAVEKNMMFFLLFFIMIVAGFGIVNSQITFVVQKTHEIGLLKALGASNRQVLWIFLSQSMIVGFVGVSLGLGLALLALTYRNDFLAFMNRMTGFELLPAAIYQIYELPASIEPSDVALICGTAFVTCVLAGLFPAWKASRLQPVEALRYE